MNKRKLIVLLCGVLLLTYFGIAYYFTRGLKIFTISITTGNILTLSLPYVFCIGLVLFLIGIVFLFKWFRTLKVAKTSAQPEDKPVADVAVINMQQEAAAETEIVNSAEKTDKPKAVVEVCGECGEQIKAGAKFCTKCGKSIVVGEKL